MIFYESYIGIAVENSLKKKKVHCLLSASRSMKSEATF